MFLEQQKQQQQEIDQVEPVDLPKKKTWLPALAFSYSMVKST